MRARPSIPPARAAHRPRRTRCRSTSFRTKDLVEGFEDSGVALPKEKRERAKAIAERVAQLGQQFAKNIRDNKSKLTLSLAEARGLPESYIERTKDGKGDIVAGFAIPTTSPS